LRDWQDETPPPLIAAEASQRLVIMADRDWLAERIERRFRMMMDQGALDEVRQILPIWDPAKQWARAIGAPELVAALKGEMAMDEAIKRAIIATRQYAKSQRIWFRGRMKEWEGWPVGA
jgi:tRNA dimethylallyltransferase